MNHSISHHLRHSRNDLRSAMRSVAFLAAIKKGAHFIFHANPEEFFQAEVPAATYRAELEHQLRKMTLGISVGLVKESPTERGYSFDPFAHFSADHAGKKGNKVMEENDADDAAVEVIHKYKICEIRPPSLEKFLQQDGYSADPAAPPLTLPGSISAPFDSRNTLFGRDALWSLLLLPNNGARMTRDDFVVRAIIAQTVLAEIGGSTKYRVSKTATVENVEELTEFGPAARKMLDFVSGWSCGNGGSALICLDALVTDLIEADMLEEDMGRIVDLWISDLTGIGYADIPALDRSSTSAATSPCIGDDALHGVYFHPSVRYRKTTRNGKLLSAKPMSATQLNRQIAEKSIKRLCPTVDVDHAFGPTLDNHENLLLIVTFNRKEYESIPLFEVIYRHHFQNILYCGEPDETVDRYMEQYNGVQDTYFSFLPAHSKTGYECLLGAIEMGYNVEGFMVVTHDTLINSWNFGKLDIANIWHGNQHARNITEADFIVGEDKLEEDSEAGKILKSTKGILQALEFLEHVLLKSPASVDEMKEHLDEAHTRYRRSEDASKEVTENSQAVEEPKTEKLVRVLEEEDAKEDDSEEEDISKSPEDLGNNHVEVTGPGSASGSEAPLGFDTPAGPEPTSPIATSLNNNETSPMLFKQNFHISLFGEITKDDEQRDSADPKLEDSIHPLITNHEQMGHAENLNATREAVTVFRNVSELLFHPANFVPSSPPGAATAEGTAAVEASDSGVKEESITPMSTSTSDKPSSSLIDNIHMTFKSILAKLKFWRGLVKSGRRHRLDSFEGELKKDLETFQCDVSTNSEICHLVADFFQTLESNEGSDFPLLYDDLPIYYVPAKYKDKLYLMANLFTKYHVADELAFPLLLRGLSPTSQWTHLGMAEMLNSTKLERPTLNRPQDLLLFHEMDDRNRALEVLESAHYVYPVDMTSVLKSDAMRDAICRNF